MSEIKNEDRYYINLDPPDPLFDITFAGITYPNPSYFKRRDVPSNIYVFEYIIRGRGYICCETGTMPVGKGDAYIINTHWPQYYYADRDDPFEKIWINATGTLIEQLTKVYGFEAPVTVRHNMSDSLLLFEEMYRVLRDVLLDSQTAKRRVSLLLHELIIRMYTGSAITENRHSDSKAVAIKSQLDRAIYSPIKLDDISSAHYLSTNHVIRVFRAAYSTTPKKYLIERRLDAADKLMVSTDLSTEEIAAMLCFCSVQHFCAAYKRLRGITPGEYKKKKQ